MSETKTLYGWTCVELDDERMDCPFDTVEEALANAKETIEEEAQDNDWEPGTRRLPVLVSRVEECRPFCAATIIDDLTQRLADDGLDDPSDHYRLYGAALDRIKSELDAVWAAHVEREKIGAYYLATHGGARHMVEVTIPDGAL